MGRTKSLHQAGKGSGVFGSIRFAFIFFATSLTATSLISSVTFAQELRIEHDIAFRRVAGLPANVRVSGAGAGVTWMRIVGIVDDALLVVPLRQKAPGEFEGEIPTPARELRYSFQFGSSAAGAQLSPVFRRAQSCVAAGPEPKEKKARLVEEAARLDADAERLAAVEKILEKVVGGEE